MASGRSIHLLISTSLIDVISLRSTIDGNSQVPHIWLHNPLLLSFHFPPLPLICVRRAVLDASQVARISHWNNSGK